jgi:hypothetical protein
MASALPLKARDAQSNAAICARNPTRFAQQINTSQVPNRGIAMIRLVKTRGLNLAARAIQTRALLRAGFSLLSIAPLHISVMPPANLQPLSGRGGFKAMERIDIWCIAARITVRVLPNFPHEGTACLIA